MDQTINQEGNLQIMEIISSCSLSLAIRIGTGGENCSYLRSWSSKLFGIHVLSMTSTKNNRLTDCFGHCVYDYDGGAGVYG